MEIITNKQKLPLISIQILNWNRAEETQRAIQSAYNQSYPNIEVVLVDNGSSDNSVELSKKNYPTMEIVKLDDNYGCPGGRNKGIEHCNGEFIFYLDNDGVLHKEAVAKAYEIIKEDESIAVVAGIVYDFDTPDEIDTEITPISNKRYQYANFQGGICMHRKSIYEKIGEYPSHFFYGGEEWYLTCKILDNDFQIIKDESIILWHRRSNVARNREKELLNTFYNKLYVSLSLFPFKYAFMFLLYFPVQYYRYAKKENIAKPFRNSLLRRYPKTVIKALKSRNPIKLSTYKKIRTKNKKQEQLKSIIS